MNDDKRRRSGNRAQLTLGCDAFFRAPEQHVDAGARIGLVTHSPARCGDGSGVLDLMADLRHVRLRKVFSPEHGLSGTQEGIVSTTRRSDSVPVISLYGERREPTREELAGLDVLCVDLQDIGARSYTYISTLSFVMKAAGEAGIPVLIFDRPNPLGGALVEGPMLESSLRSFTGIHEIPIRHGMTTGELALMFANHFGVECNIRVVPMEDWRRSHYFDETGLSWTPPSPAMPRFECALAYPGLCLFEATNLSVGRGTELPFTWIGAPWLERGTGNREQGTGRSVLQSPGVEFTPEVRRPARPSDARYHQEECWGIRLRVTDREAFRPVLTGALLIRAIVKARPGDMRIDSDGLDRLAGTPRLRETILHGDEGEILQITEAGVSSFRKARLNYLLYR